MNHISMSNPILACHHNKSKIIKVNNYYAACHGVYPSVTCAFWNRFQNAAATHPVGSQVGSGFHRMCVHCGTAALRICSVLRCLSLPAVFIFGVTHSLALPGCWSCETDEKELTHDRIIEQNVVYIQSHKPQISSCSHLEESRKD